VGSGGSGRPEQCEGESGLRAVEEQVRRALTWLARNPASARGAFQKGLEMRRALALSREGHTKSGPIRPRRPAALGLRAHIADALVPFSYSPRNRARAALHRPSPSYTDVRSISCPGALNRGPATIQCWCLPTRPWPKSRNHGRNEMDRGWTERLDGRCLREAAIP
jgi:hypothetical protein